MKCLRSSLVSLAAASLLFSLSCSGPCCEVGAQPAAAELVQVEACPKCKQERFGVDWQRVGVPSTEQKIRLPDNVNHFLDAWRGLPERLERNFWLGGFVFGHLATLIVVVAGMTLNRWRKG